jgi:DNA-binding MarR family transcriptional regulator
LESFSSESFSTESTRIDSFGKDAMLSSCSPTPDQRLLALVHRASAAGRALRRLLADEAAAVGLSDVELLVVWLCDEGPGLAQVELAHEVGISPAQMSATVERLRQRGLIAVQRSALDRRRQVWRTTDGGRQALAALKPAIERAAAGIDARFAPDDQLAMSRLALRLAGTVAGLSAGEPAPQELPSPLTGAAA